MPFLNTGQRGEQSSRIYSGLLSKFGPRKTWHLFGLLTDFGGIVFNAKANFTLFLLHFSGTLCILASFPFIFMPCVGCSTSSQWAQVIYFAGFIVIFQFGWAAVQVSHLSLIPVLAHDERSRTELTALRYFYYLLCNLRRKRSLKSGKCGLRNMLRYFRVRSAISSLHFERVIWFQQKNLVTRDLSKAISFK